MGEIIELSRFFPAGLIRDVLRAAGTQPVPRRPRLSLLCAFMVWSELVFPVSLAGLFRPGVSTSPSPWPDLAVFSLWPETRNPRPGRAGLSPLYPAM